jgi:hypothetical protein
MSIEIKFRVPQEEGMSWSIEKPRAAEDIPCGM